MTEQKIINVKFVCRQGAEDLFVSVDNPLKVYARQRSNDKGIVFWCTVNKWIGGYEASCPLREGITMQVVDERRKVIFRETLQKDEWNGGTSAKKEGLFSDELMDEIARKVEEKYGLKTYEQWKKWLNVFSTKYEYCGYSDNWLFCMNNEQNSECLGSHDYFGKPIYLYKTKCVHKVCGAKWEVFEIRYSGEDLCLALCGFRFEEDSGK